jgi:hypothetical protein
MDPSLEQNVRRALFQIQYAGVMALSGRDDEAAEAYAECHSILAQSVVLLDEAEAKLSEFNPISEPATLADLL